MPADRDNLERVLEAKTRLTRKEGDAMRKSTPPKTTYGSTGKGWAPARMLAAVLDFLTSLWRREPK